MICSKRSHRKERPTRCPREQLPIATMKESLCSYKDPAQPKINKVILQIEQKLRDERETQDTAMEETEFQRFVTPLKEALEGYRREQKGKKEASERKKDKDKTKLIRKSRTSAGMRTTIKMRSG
ncbi:hypothetical protein MJT46_004562 [Ovis ammon polii x Ovis aries]|nr:hypothetical protein MJT46_004562 [Ovis ammon polii x Ovis aries]